MSCLHTLRAEHECTDNLSLGDVTLSLTSNFVPSALTEIDGQNVYDFLENWGELGRLQDRDAS